MGPSTRKNLVATLKNIIVGFVTLFLVISPSVFFGALPITAFASTTNGTIDTTNKYTWGNQIGWLNFGASGGNIQITDSALTGYVWSQNYGWINLNPAQSGVLNDSNGNLSGYAWGENLGYINFSSVVIDNSGRFTGTASGTVAGQITFDCANCNVSTDWRPANTRTTVAQTSSGGGGGNAKPSLPLAVLINGGALYTNNPNVVLTLVAGPDSKGITVSNSPDFYNTSQEPFVYKKNWNLCFGSVATGGNCPEGDYTVYVKFYTSWGQASEVMSASIAYSKISPDLAQATSTPTSLLPAPTPQLQEELFSFIGEIGEQLKIFLGGLFGREASPVPQELASVISRVTPEPLKGAWILLSSEKLNEFVFAPLPKDIKTLAQKIPTLQKILAEVGVYRQADLYKLRGIDFSVPGLAKEAGLATVKLSGAGFALPAGIPLAALGPVARQKLPDEIVFARSADEKIDFNIKLKLNDKGQIEKRIETIVGSTIKLVVRTAPGSTVKGYLVFRSRYKAVSVEDENSISLNQSLASLIFSAPAIAEAFQGPFRILPPDTDITQMSGNENTTVEERLALQEFDYTEPYHDGVFVTEIPAPRVPGEYDIITVIQYKDPELGTKEIRLTAVVDPEGYVYEQTGNKETRIPEVTVRLYALNPENGQYELWQAKNYGQENPQVTDIRGTYSFLVPQGSYYLTADADGYIPFKGDVFSVDGANEVHLNIELKSKYWFLKFADWKSALLAVVILLLLYNFYGDWKRKKFERSEH